jgi:hypothetical protein
MTPLRDALWDVSSQVCSALGRFVAASATMCLGLVIPPSFLLLSVWNGHTFGQQVKIANSKQ